MPNPTSFTLADIARQIRSRILVMAGILIVQVAVTGLAAFQGFSSIRGFLESDDIAEYSVQELALQVADLTGRAQVLVLTVTVFGLILGLLMAMLVARTISPDAIRAVASAAAGDPADSREGHRPPGIGSRDASRWPK